MTPVENGIISLMQGLDRAHMAWLYLSFAAATVNVLSAMSFTYHRLWNSHDASEPWLTVTSVVTLVFLVSVTLALITAPGEVAHFLLGLFVLVIIVGLFFIALRYLRLIMRGPRPTTNQ